MTHLYNTRIYGFMGVPPSRQPTIFADEFAEIILPVLVCPLYGEVSKNRSASVARPRWY